MECYYFKPKTYEDVCQAMKMRANVEIDGVKGLVVGVQVCPDAFVSGALVTIQPNVTDDYKITCQTVEFYW
jgi:hypothetical protein